MAIDSRSPTRNMCFSGRNPTEANPLRIAMRCENGWPVRFSMIPACSRCSANSMRRCMRALPIPSPRASGWDREPAELTRQIRSRPRGVDDRSGAHNLAIRFGDQGENVLGEDRLLQPRCVVELAVRVVGPVHGFEDVAYDSGVGLDRLAHRTWWCGHSRPLFCEMSRGVARHASHPRRPCRGWRAHRNQTATNAPENSRAPALERRNARKLRARAPGNRRSLRHPCSPCAASRAESHRVPPTQRRERFAPTHRR